MATHQKQLEIHARLYLGHAVHNYELCQLFARNMSAVRQQDSTILWTKGATTVPTLAIHCNDLKSVTQVVVPEGYTEMANGAFCGLSALEYVTIPSSVRVISSNAFTGCTALKEVDIASGAIYVATNAFSGCTSLSTLHTPDSVAQICPTAFRGCSHLVDVSLPEEALSVFPDCKNINVIARTKRTTA